MDLLRSLRQQHHERLRFLYTGSIGSHLVLKSLRKAGNVNEPVNDMYQETVPPMSEADAMELATRLLKGLDTPPKDVAGVARAIYQAVEGFPYYIHHVVDWLGLRGQAPNEAEVRAAVAGVVSADEDRAQLSYYLKRLKTYYEPDEQKLALRVLDGLAGQPGPVSLETLVNLVRHQWAEAPEEQIRDICLLLRRDHYLTLDTSGDTPVYGFRWGIVKRWWKENRL